MTHSVCLRMRTVTSTYLSAGMEASCCVCSGTSVKYRCPQCRVRYCSLSCYKTHKETCVSKEASPSTEASFPAKSRVVPQENRADDLSIEDDDESDQVSLQKLKLLGESEELKNLLLNPHLRQLISTLDQAESKDQELKKYMQEPLFVEFADRCLSIVDTEEKENLFRD